MSVSMRLHVIHVVDGELTHGGQGGDGTGTRIGIIIMRRLYRGLNGTRRPQANDAEQICVLLVRL